MKSLAKIIISLGIKIAIVALFVAIAIGLSSCKGCSAAVDPSFSTDIIQETSNASETLRESGTPVPSNTAETSSLVLQDNESQKNSDVKTPDETRNDDVAKPTEQTANNNTDSGSNTREDDSDPVNEELKPTATPAPNTNNNSSSSSESSSSGGGSTATATNTPVPTATPTPVPTDIPTPEPTATTTPEPDPDPVYEWVSGYATIHTTYDDGEERNIPIDIPGMPVEVELCDGELTGRAQATAETEDAVWSWLESQYPGFCGMGHVKAVTGTAYR